MCSCVHANASRDETTTDSHAAARHDVHPSDPSAPTSRLPRTSRTRAVSLAKSRGGASTEIKVPPMGHHVDSVHESGGRVRSDGTVNSDAAGSGATGERAATTRDPRGAAQAVARDASASRLPLGACGAAIGRGPLPAWRGNLRTAGIRTWPRARARTRRRSPRRHTRVQGSRAPVADPTTTSSTSRRIHSPFMSVTARRTPHVASHGPRPFGARAVVVLAAARRVPTFFLADSTTGSRGDFEGACAMTGARPSAAAPVLASRRSHRSATSGPQWDGPRPSRDGDFADDSNRREGPHAEPAAASFASDALRPREPGPTRGAWGQRRPGAPCTPPDRCQSARPIGHSHCARHWPCPASFPRTSLQLPARTAPRDGGRPVGAQGA